MTTSWASNNHISFPPTKPASGRSRSLLAFSRHRSLSGSPVVRFGLGEFADLPKDQVRPGDVIQPQHYLSSEGPEQPRITGARLFGKQLQRPPRNSRLYLSGLTRDRLLVFRRVLRPLVEKFCPLPNSDRVNMLDLRGDRQRLRPFISLRDPPNRSGVPKALRLRAIIARAIPRQRFPRAPRQNSVHSRHSNLFLMLILYSCRNPEFSRTPTWCEQQHRTHEPDR